MQCCFGTNPMLRPVALFPTYGCFRNCIENYVIYAAHYVLCCRGISFARSIIVLVFSVYVVVMRRYFRMHRVSRSLPVAANRCRDLYGTTAAHVLSAIVAYRVRTTYIRLLCTERVNSCTNSERVCWSKQSARLRLFLYIPTIFPTGLKYSWQ